MTLFTPELGKFKAIAKGVRRTTSRLGGALEPLAELRVALARGRTFDVVTQVEVSHAWLRLRDSLESAATAWYLAELADRSIEERHEAEGLYGLLRHAYELLDAGMDAGRVARWYEMNLADELGVRPEVDRCVRYFGGCGQAAQGVPANGRRGTGRPAAPAGRRARGRGGDARLPARVPRTRRPLPRLPRRGTPNGRGHARGWVWFWTWYSRLTDGRAMAPCQ